MRVAFAWAVMLVMLASALPLATASHEPYRVDVVLAIDDSDTLTLRQTIGYDASSPVNWNLLVPSGYTFVSAVDDEGRALSASADGSDLQVRTTATGAAREFTLTFTSPATQSGAYRVGRAGLVALSDSPTSATHLLPDGWTLVASRELYNKERGPAATLASDGVYRGEGPFNVAYVFLPPGLDDPGPDRRAVGEAVLREAVANVTASGGTLALTVSYDTDVYGADWHLAIPAGHTATRVATQVGDVAFTSEAGQLSTTLPYPTGHSLGGRPFTVYYDLPAPQSHGGAYLKQPLGVAAADGDFVSLAVGLAPDLQLTGTLVNGAIARGPLSWSATEPIAVTLGLVADPGADEVEFQLANLTFRAPAAREAVARQIATKAVEILPAATAYVGLDALDQSFYVAWTDADVFDWESGFYSSGFDTISIRASELDDAAGGDSHAVASAVSTLVHEIAHGLVEHRLPAFPGGFSFLDEGLARLAEAHVERALGDDALFACKGTIRQSCTRQSSRPDGGDVQAFYEQGQDFQVDWDADAVSESQRGFLYDYSGFVFNAYEQRSGTPALQDVLARLDATRPTAADAPAAILGALQAQAPDLPLSAILYPGRTIVALPEDDFEACLADLVAPPFPFDDEGSRPSDGCGDIDMRGGTGDAPPPPPDGSAPPAPPTAQADDELPPPPSGGGTSNVGGASQTGAGSGASGAASDDGAESSSSISPIDVPGPGLLALLAAMALVAFGRRPRR